MKNNISIDDYSNWTNKIVFAPNASGKSRLAKLIYDKETDGTQSYQFFSSSKIQQLVNTSSESSFFIGQTSSFQKQNEDIEKECDNSKVLTNLASVNYGVTSANKLANLSATMQYFSVKNLSKGTIQLLTTMKDYLLNKDIIQIAQEDTTILDKLINPRVIKNISSIDAKIDFKTDKGSGSELIIETIYQNLKKIRQYQYIRNDKQCLLCGHVFDNCQELMNAIDATISNYSTESIKNAESVIDDVLTNIQIDSIGDSTISKYIKNIDLTNYKGKVSFLFQYYFLFNGVVKELYRTISASIPNIEEKIDLYSQNTATIIKEKNNLLIRKDFQNTVKTEFQKLVFLPSNIKLDFEDNKLRVYVDGEVRTPSEVLSDSEVKRLALAVLKGIIMYSDVKMLILDDPIDSYDDYYAETAALYIASMLNEFQSGQWLFLSHMFLAANIISKVLKSDVTVYYQDPSFIYEYVNSHSDNNPSTFVADNSILPPIKHLVMSYGEFDNLKDSEIILFKKVLQTKKKTEFYYVELDFAFLSFFTTIRGTKNDIINNNINVHDSLNCTPSVQSYVDKIEGAFLHYNPNKPQPTFNDLENLIHCWYLISPSCIAYKAIRQRNIGTLVNYRKKLLHSSYDSLHANSAILKSILYKMLWVSMIKYDFEESLYNKMVSNGEVKRDIKKILKTRTLGKKIDEANRLFSNRYQNYKDVHTKFRNLINDFSHGVIRMFPPYLSTSVLDISKFAVSVSMLN